MRDVAIHPTNRGACREPKDSDEFRLRAERYFEGYVLSSLRPARDIFEYDV